jgi:hypothetical protein
MSTLVLGNPPPELKALFERRRVSGRSTGTTRCGPAASGSSVDWLGLEASRYRPVERSALLNLGPDELAEQIDWPRDFG